MSPLDFIPKRKTGGNVVCVRVPMLTMKGQNVLSKVGK